MQRRKKTTLMKILKKIAARNNIQGWVVANNIVLIIQKSEMFQIKTKRA
jgi:hypothetical protein